MGIVAQRTEHLRRPHKTVRHKVRIQVSSRRGATRIRARGNCPLKGPSPGLRYVKCGKGAIVGPKEPVSAVVCVSIHTHDRPLRVDADCVSTCVIARYASARSIERSKLSVGTPQKAVIHTVRVTVDPRDHSQLIEAEGTTGTTCTLVAAGARAWNVKRFQFALGIAHEAVVKSFGESIKEE